MRQIVSPIPLGMRRIPGQETADQANRILVQLQKFPRLRWLVPARVQPGPLAGRTMDPGTGLSFALLPGCQPEQARGSR